MNARTCRPSPSSDVVCSVLQLASPPPCNVTVLQQIDEESTCDNNPWTLEPQQTAPTCGHTSIYDSRKPVESLMRIFFLLLLLLFSVRDCEGERARRLSTLMFLWYSSCIKCKGSACTRVLNVLAMKLVIVFTITEADLSNHSGVRFTDIGRVLKGTFFFFFMLLFPQVSWY